MRILLFVAVAGLTGCGGTASSGPEMAGGSSGAAGSAGSQGGGMSGGGGGGQAGGAPTDCGSSVTFRLEGGTPAAESSFCQGRPGSCEGGGSWLSVLNAAGEPVSMSLGCNSTACSQCQSTGCPLICLISTPLPEEGVESEWNGVTWQGGQTCGDNLPCATPGCAAPGSYVARMCGYARTGTAEVEIPSEDCEVNAVETPTCVDVPFEWPSTGIVEGVLNYEP